MLWLYISLAAYLLNAITATIDKVLLTSSIPHPRIYTFFISILGVLGVVIAPWGLTFISFNHLFISFLIGIFAVLAMWSLFTALVKQEASRVIPIVGGVQPILIFFFAFIFLNERLGSFEVLALVLFILGGILITYEKRKKGVRNYRWLFFAISSGLSFGMVHFLSKYLFTELTFINGFVWPRIMTFLIALLFLLDKSFIKELRSGVSGTNPSSKALFLIGQISGASFFILINYAISLGSVTIINALQGIQYVFVLIFTTIISFYRPGLLKESLQIQDIIQKVFSILLIMIGIALISL